MNNELIKFSFILSGGEQITRTMEIRGIDQKDMLSLRRYDERYIIQIGPHAIDLPAKLMKDLVENILLTYPEDEDLKDIIASMAQDKPWLFERLLE